MYWVGIGIRPLFLLFCTCGTTRVQASFSDLVHMWGCMSRKLEQGSLHYWFSMMYTAQECGQPQ